MEHETPECKILAQDVLETPPHSKDSLHVTERGANRERLRNCLMGHSFIPYEKKVVCVLSSVIKTLVCNRETYPRFDGLTWVFARCDGRAADAVIDWNSSILDQVIDRSGLLSLYGSTDAPSHDAAGVFACSSTSKENRLIASGAMLKRDMQAMMRVSKLVSAIKPEDENRTGHTSAMYAAWRSDALVLKVSATDRSIKIFHCEASGGESVEVSHLEDKLLEHLRGQTQKAEGPYRASQPQVQQHGSAVDSGMHGRESRTDENGDALIFYDAVEPARWDFKRNSGTLQNGEVTPAPRVVRQRKDSEEAGKLKREDAAKSDFTPCYESSSR